MELARLYPRWVTAVMVGPQGWVQTDHPHSVLTTLKWGLLHRCGLADLFGTDYPGRPQRVQITWTLWSYLYGVRWHLQAFPAELASTVPLWPAATWWERELWEMFGVAPRGHPDLRRLLTDYGFAGRPLLKDFPVGGYVEVRYSEKKKRIAARAVSFVQEFRFFDFRSPWQN